MDSLQHVRANLAERQAHTSRHTVSAGSISLNAEGRLVADRWDLRIAADAEDQLARLARIPTPFFQKCPASLRANMFNTLYGQLHEQGAFPESFDLVVRNNELLTGLVNHRLACLSGAEVLDIALNARPEEIDASRLEVSSFHLNGDLGVSIVSRQLQSEPRVGDIVRAGIDVFHSETAAFATQISSYLMRLACSNGMLARVCTHTSGGRARVRRAAADNADLTRRRVHQMSEQAWGELQAKMAAVEQLAQEKVDNASELIRSVGEKLRLSDNLIQEIVCALDRDELGRSGTLWDVVGAISRVGSRSDRLGRAIRRYLQELSGELIHERVARCPTCGAVQPRSVRYLPRR